MKSDKDETKEHLIDELELIRRQIAELEAAVTETKRTEAKYSTLVNKSNDDIIVIQDGRLALVNAKMTEITGYSPEEALGKPFIDFVAPDYRTLVADRYKSRMMGEVAPDRYEAEVLSKKGTKIHVEINASLIEHEGKSAVMAIVRDITERMNMEAELTRLRLAVDASGEAIFLTDIDGTFLYANPAFTRLYGYSPEEVIGKATPRVLKSGKMKEQDYEIFWNTLLNKEIVKGEIVNRTKNDDQLYVENSANPVIDDHGNIIGFLAIQRDVTERKHAEAEISKFKTVSDLSPYGITMINADLVITYTNKTCARLHGYTREELIGHLCTVLVPEEQVETVTALFDESRKTGGFANKEIMHKRKDGTTFPAMMSGVTVKDNNGKPLYTSIIFLDITEQKKAQEQLILTDRLAAVGQLAAGIAHELNNPLTSIIGFSGLLLDRRDISPDAREDLETVNREAQRTAGVVRGLLAFARKQKTEKEPLDIHSIIRGVLQLRNYEQRVNNIEVDTRFAPDLPQVNGNNAQLQQVIVNIVINAEQAMLEAHNRGKLTIATERLENKLRISITDDGPGISPENMKRLFTPFFTTKAVGKGTGLGLSICHGIITEHGGNIYAESKAGEGATFIVELPVVSQQPDGG